MRGIRPFGELLAMRFSPVKLFHAVVVSGAALTSCAGPTPKKPVMGTLHNQPAIDSAKAPPPTEAVDAGTCPADAELPYPPCYLIL